MISKDWCNLEDKEIRRYAESYAKEHYKTTSLLVEKIMLKIRKTHKQPGIKSQDLLNILLVGMSTSCVNFLHNFIVYHREHTTEQLDLSKLLEVFIMNMIGVLTYDDQKKVREKLN